MQEKAEYFKDSIRPENEEFKKKKVRRPADQIDKEYSCPYDRCDRKSGTEASLRIHIKKKHSQMYQPRRKSKTLIKDEDHPISDEES